MPTLYICPNCYTWQYSIGLFEAMAIQRNAELKQECPICSHDMLRFQQGTPIHLPQEDGGKGKKRKLNCPRPKYYT